MKLTKLNMLILPVAILGALACAEPETEVTETEPVVTETEMVDTTPMLEETDWWAYSDWDADANQQVARAEFDTRWQSGFAEWDVDGDGALGPDEAADTFWDWFDGNDDNIIDTEEWNTSVARWDFDSVDWGEMQAWDADTNAELSETEWRDGWNSGVWTTWDPDGDGALGRDEAADTFWDFFDGNDDDIIDAGEWGTQT